jgi:hypothetical protein
MKKFLLLSILFIFAISTFAQLNHSTGSLQVTTLPKAYIGHGGSGTGGSGVIFNSSTDAMYTAGIMYGTPVSKIRGSIGSFTSATGGPLLIDDMVNTTPLTGFTSNAFFNQITSQVVKDQAATAPLNLDVQVQSYSNTGDNFVFYVLTFTNNTAAAVQNLYAGIFADWDVGGTAYETNRGGFDIPRKLIYQYGTTTADMKYYGLTSLTPYSGSRVTADFPGANETIRDTIFSWITTSNATPITIGADFRSFIGSGPFNVPVGGTAVAAFAVVVGADLAAIQANTDLAQTKYNTQIVPVELTSFTADVANGNVSLKWTTATEINNRGFEIERSNDNNDFRVIGFVSGNGTTSEVQNYSFSDNGLPLGKYYYRLKQVDFNGQYEYSDVVEVNLDVPGTFTLNQNYPNPFNPSTRISYSLAEAGHVRLSVFNLLGEEIAVIVDGIKDAGSHEVNFEANQLASGFYIYKIQTAQFTQSRKMLLNK